MGRAEFGCTGLGQRFARKGPFEGVGIRAIVVLQEQFQVPFQVGKRDEIAAAHDLSHHDSENDLDLIQPGTVFRKVDKPDAMAQIRQKLATARLRFQDTRFPFFFPRADLARRSPPPIPPDWPTREC